MMEHVLTTIYFVCSLTFPTNERAPIFLGVPDARGIDHIRMQFQQIVLECNKQSASQSKEKT